MLLRLWLLLRARLLHRVRALLSGHGARAYLRRRLAGRRPVGTRRDLPASLDLAGHPSPSMVHHLRVRRATAHHGLLPLHHLLLLLLLHPHHVHPLLLVDGHLWVHLLHPLMLHVLLLHHHLVLLLWWHVLHSLLVLLLLHRVGKVLLLLHLHRPPRTHDHLPCGPHLRSSGDGGSLNVNHALTLLGHHLLRLTLHDLGLLYMLLRRLLLLLLLLLLLGLVVIENHLVLPVLFPDLVQSLLPVRRARRHPRQLGLVDFAEIGAVLLHSPLFRV